MPQRPGCSSQTPGASLQLYHRLREKFLKHDVHWIFCIINTITTKYITRLVNYNKTMTRRIVYGRLFVLFVSIVISFLSASETSFGKWMKFVSNLAFIIPLQMSYELEKYTFTLLIGLIMAFSFMWHLCGVDVCMTTKLGDMDVEFSRWGMLTALSYLLLGERFHEIFPLNVALSVVFNSYDNWIPYAIAGSVYLILIFTRCLVPQQNLKYDSVDTVFAIFSGGLSLYLFESFNDHAYVHSLWHTLDAIAFSLLLTCFSKEKYHTFGLRANQQKKTVSKSKSQENKPLLGRLRL